MPKVHFIYPSVSFYPAAEKVLHGSQVIFVYGHSIKMYLEANLSQKIEIIDLSDNKDLCPLTVSMRLLSKYRDSLGFVNEENIIELSRELAEFLQELFYNNISIDKLRTIDYSDQAFHCAQVGSEVVNIYKDYLTTIDSSPYTTIFDQYKDQDGITFII